MNRRTLMALMLAPLLCVGAQAQGLPEKITIATEGAYPPWNFTNADGSLAGYEIELTNLLCERMGVKCTLVAQEWNGIIPGLTVGKYDAIIASMGVTEERKKVVSFSKPYAQAPNGFLTLSDSAIKDLPNTGVPFNLVDGPDEAKAAIEGLKAAISGKVIGVQSSTTAASFIAEYFKGVEVREYPSFEQLSLELTAGRIDIAVANVTAFKAVIDASPLVPMEITGPTFAGGILGLGTTNVALRPGDDALRAAFDEAISSINKDGTNKALTEKWFGLDISIAE